VGSVLGLRRSASGASKVSKKDKTKTDKSLGAFELMAWERIFCAILASGKYEVDEAAGVADSAFEEYKIRSPKEMLERKKDGKV